MQLPRRMFKTFTKAFYLILIHFECRLMAGNLFANKAILAEYIASIDKQMIANISLEFFETNASKAMKFWRVSPFNHSPLITFSFIRMMINLFATIRKQQASIEIASKVWLLDKSDLNSVPSS